jgi:flagellar biosynthetic protein FliP
MQKIQRLCPLLLGVVMAVGMVLAVASLAWAGSATASPVPAPTALGASTRYLATGQSGTGPSTGPEAPVTATPPDSPETPASSAGTGNGTSSGGTVSVNLGGTLGKPSESITILIGLTLLAVAPSLLILLTSFTRIIIVLSLTRQALGLQNVPPNQLLAGLALFLSLFVMSPVISQVNTQAVQPYLAGKITAEQAYTDAQAPLRTWMLKQTQADDLALFEKKGTPKLTSPAAMPMAAVVPAFALSEMRSAFIIGFVIFVPFLVIDLVVSSTLMSLGMMMLPPSLVSLPFKLLLFVLIDGWALVTQSLLASFH